MFDYCNAATITLKPLNDDSSVKLLNVSYIIVFSFALVSCIYGVI